MDKELVEWAKGLKGHTIDGKYTLDDFVNHGKIGFVYKAHRVKFPNHTIAIKLVFERLPNGWETELEKVQSLTGVAGVVQFQDLGAADISANGQSALAQYTVWQYIEPGRNLREYLNDTENVSVSFCIAVLEQTLRVLNACQAHGIKRHGDLHAGNILIGKPEIANIDSSLEPIETIYISDFGHGTTDGEKQPKDDYPGLALIFNEISKHIDWGVSTSEERKLLTEVHSLISKCLQEKQTSEKLTPRAIYLQIQAIKNKVSRPKETISMAEEFKSFSVGNFQSSEMFGDHWERWKALFVSSVPARSHIFDPGISTVITGPRGCGKTTLFRRLSKRLQIECGPADDKSDEDFIGLYINANDIADAFPAFSYSPSHKQIRAITTFFNLCLVSDFAGVVSALHTKGEEIPIGLIEKLYDVVLQGKFERKAISGENKIELFRSEVEILKRKFLSRNNFNLEICDGEIGNHVWLEGFITEVIRKYCDWADTSKHIFILVDDYTLPRIKVPMQKVLNRILFKRSEAYICKVATEAATTFVPEDISKKLLQIHDDYALIDMGAESIVMSKEERKTFLNEIFSKRLAFDKRIPKGAANLESLLGAFDLSQNELARRLRKKNKPNYHGADCFVGLWSGDTRTMLLIMQDLVDTAASKSKPIINTPIEEGDQNNVYTVRGGQWIEELSNCEPSDAKALSRFLDSNSNPSEFKGLVQDDYGSHLKAIAQAFQARASKQLMEDSYWEGKNEIVRSAFRIEIFDEFRIDGLAYQIYSDLIRYGIFLRDGRGKSVRGALIPRLFLRRLVLPYCNLAMTTKHSIQMSNAEFRYMLLSPDSYIKDVRASRKYKDKKSEDDKRQGDLLNQDGDET